VQFVGQGATGANRAALHVEPPRYWVGMRGLGVRVLPWFINFDCKLAQ